MTARISVSVHVRDRLKTYGHARMTYGDILTHLMDRVQREDFVRELRQRYAKTTRRAYLDLDDL